VLFDAVHDHAFCHALLAAVAGKKRLREDGAELAGLRAAGFEPPADLDAMQPFLPGGGRPNTTVYFDQRLVLKLYRRIEPGIHPEVELGRFLTERAGFPHTPPLAGWLELRSERDEPCAVAAVHAFAANEDTAWRLTLDAVGRYFERLSVERRDGGGRAASLLEPGGEGSGRPIDLVDRPLPEPGGELLGAFPGWARRLGERTAELHLTLAGAEGEAGGDPELAPEPFTTLYQRSLYQSMRAGARRTLGRLERLAPGLPLAAAGLAGELLARRDEL
jgi:maltose alpha-D-glucosyltransferase/alpha-amylase